VGLHHLRRIDHAVECLLVHEPTDGKEDQGEAISAKPFPEKTAEYPDRIDCFQE
jgi:hypothetical protein